MMLNCLAAGDDSGAWAAMSTDAASAKMLPSAWDPVGFCMRYYARAAILFSVS